LGGKARDKRRSIDAVFGISRLDAPWRDLSPDRGDWENTRRRFCRRRDKGVRQPLPETVTDEPDFEWPTIDAGQMKVLALTEKDSCSAMSDLYQVAINRQLKYNNPIPIREGLLCGHRKRYQKIGLQNWKLSEKKNGRVLSSSAFCVYGCESRRTCRLSTSRK
jgi:hypothetical protein